MKITQFPHNKLRIAVLLAVGVTPGLLLADTEVTALGSIDVVGILPKKLDGVPGSFAIIDRADLEQRRAFSVEETLNTVPGIHVVGENTMGLGVNIGMRGLDPRRSSRTLLLEDGMPLFLGPYGDPSAHYTTPTERVDTIEVVKGSGQVLYGPQTIGGMINFVTQPVPENGREGSVTASVGNNNYTGIAATIGAGNEKGGVRLDVIKKQGDGIRTNHDFDVSEYTLKGKLNLNDKQTLTAKLSQFTEDSHVSETGLGTVEYAEDPFQAPTGKNDRFEQERTTAQVQHTLEINDKAKLSTQAYYVDNSRASFRQTNEPGSLDGRSVMDRCEDLGVATEENAELCGGRWRPRDFQYWGIEPRLDISHNAFGVENEAVIGMRYHKETQERNQFRGADPRFQDKDYATSFVGVNGGTGHREQIDIDLDAKSYYAQNTSHLGDWSITPGVRVEDLTINTDVKRAEGQPQNNPESQLSNKQTKVLPGFGVAWNGKEKTTVFAGVHKGFAPPRPDRDISADGANSAVVSNTKPEESTNWELGVRSKPKPGITTEATVFHTDFDEVVIQDNGRFFNGGKTQQNGVELAGRVDFGVLNNTSSNVYLQGSYTHLANAKFKTDVADEDILSGNRMPYAPKHLASVNLGYEHPNGLDARIGVNHVSEQFADGANTTVENESGEEGTIPAYTLLNASLNYKPGNSKASYFISAENLADKEYLASRVDGKTAGRGRQIMGGVSFDF